MTTSKNLSPQDCELAALFAADCLEGPEAKAFEMRLKGDRVLSKEVSSLREAFHSLGDQVPKANPNPMLKARLLDRIGAQPFTVIRKGPRPNWNKWLDSDFADGSTIVRDSQGEWEQTGFEGVRVKKLFVDSSARQVSMLVEMDPGCSYPSHRHGGPEECYVLSGDLHCDDMSLFKGDYQRAESGTCHGAQYTEQGCMLLIISSMDDHILQETSV